MQAADGSVQQTACKSWAVACDCRSIFQLHVSQPCLEDLLKQASQQLQPYAGSSVTHTYAQVISCAMQATLCLQPACTLISHSCLQIGPYGKASWPVSKYLYLQCLSAGSQVTRTCAMALCCAVPVRLSLRACQAQDAASQCNHVSWADQSDSVLCRLPSHTSLCYGPLLCGASTLVFEGVPSYPDAGRCWQVVAKYSLTPNIKLFVLSLQLTR